MVRFYRRVEFGQCCVGKRCASLPTLTGLGLMLARAAGQTTRCSNFEARVCMPGSSESPVLVFGIRMRKMSVFCP